MTREDKRIKETNSASEHFIAGPLCEEKFTEEEQEFIEYCFAAGAQWADENPQSPWIDVKEKLPYNNPNFIHFDFTNRVLVRNKNGDLFVAYMKKNKDNKWIWCNDLDDNFDLLSCVTHWMYIPNLPEE